jgi:hypothetical protein
VATRVRTYLTRLVRPAFLGTVRRTTPLSPVWGFDRGTPVDRYYIEQFLTEQRSNIRGRVLEVKDDAYTRRFGQGVARGDVLDIDPGNANATVRADLAVGDGIPRDAFDCFILTQTLHLIYRCADAVTSTRRLLRAGGVALVTVPALSKVTGADPVGSDFWRFTPASCSALFGEVFGSDNVLVRPYGNVLTGMAFLTGMAHEELSSHELDTHDPRFPLIIAVRAIKV